MDVVNVGAKRGLRRRLELFEGGFSIYAQKKSRLRPGSYGTVSESNPLFQRHTLFRYGTARGTLSEALSVIRAQAGRPPLEEIEPVSTVFSIDSSDVRRAVMRRAAHALEGEGSEMRPEAIVRRAAAELAAGEEELPPAWQFLCGNASGINLYVFEEPEEGGSMRLHMPPTHYRDRPTAWLYRSDGLTYPLCPRKMPKGTKPEFLFDATSRVVQDVLNRHLSSRDSRPEKGPVTVLMDGTCVLPDGTRHRAPDVLPVCAGAVHLDTDPATLSDVARSEIPVLGRDLVEASAASPPGLPWTRLDYRVVGHFVTFPWFALDYVQAATAARARSKDPISYENSTRSSVTGEAAAFLTPSEAQPLSRFGVPRSEAVLAELQEAAQVAFFRAVADSVSRGFEGEPPAPAERVEDDVEFEHYIRYRSGSSNPSAAFAWWAQQSEPARKRLVSEYYETMGDVFLSGKLAWFARQTGIFVVVMRPERSISESRREPSDRGTLSKAADIFEPGDGASWWGARVLILQAEPPGRTVLTHQLVRAFSEGSYRPRRMHVLKPPGSKKLLYKSRDLFLPRLIGELRQTEEA